MLWQGFNKQEANIKQFLAQTSLRWLLNRVHFLCSFGLSNFLLQMSDVTLLSSRFLTSKGVAPIAVVMDTFRVSRRWLESHKDFFAPRRNSRLPRCPEFDDLIFSNLYCSFLYDPQFPSSCYAFGS